MRSWLAKSVLLGVCAAVVVGGGDVRAGLREPIYMVDSPTAGILGHGEYHIQGRIGPEKTEVPNLVGVMAHREFIPAVAVEIGCFGRDITPGVAVGDGGLGLGNGCDGCQGARSGREKLDVKAIRSSPRCGAG